MRKILVTLLLLVGFSFNSCQHKQANATNSNLDFTTYINAFTSGIISNADPIIIELAQEQKVKAGAQLDPDILSFSPEIKGNAVWKNPFTIVFTPEDRLPNSIKFTGHFKLGKIIEVPKKLKKFDFNFQTKTQALDVKIQGMQAYDPKNLQWNKLEGTLSTADFADNIAVEACLFAVQNAQTKTIRWTHDYDLKKHHFVIDSIQRKQKASDVIVQWNGKPIGAKNKGEKVIEIPSINDFSLMNVAVQNDPDQVVKLYFSDPVHPTQNLKGLIRFKDNTPVQLKREGNLIKVYPKKRIKKPIKLIISRNIRNTMGKHLGKQYIKQIVFTSLKPDLKAVNKGNILPDANGLIFPFQAVNLKAVNLKIIKIFEDNVPQFFQVNQYDGQRELARVGRVVLKKEMQLLSDKAIDYGTWNTFALDLSELIKIEPGAVYRVELSFNKNQSLYDCPKQKNEPAETIMQDNDSAYEGPSDNYYYYDDEYYYEDYDYSQRENPCSNSYYYGNRHKIKQNIIASNFGIITKEDANHLLHTYITDLRTAKNIPGVKISIYNYQHQLIGQATTNAEGQTAISLDQKPFLLVAKKDGQYGYLRLDNGNALSLSMFDISGQKIQKGVKGYLFTERGVWRPGDSIYLNFILDDKQKQLPEKHPVVLEVYTPQNQLFLRKVNTQPIGNFYDFRFATPSEAPTGNWHAKIKVGGAQFSKTLKIEAIKPNRLKIKLRFKDQILHQNDKQFTLQANWLHGAPAANLRAEVEMKLSQGKTVFKAYPDYHFDDASKPFYGENEILFNGKLNKNGQATIPLNIHVKEAPGMLQAHFKTRVFEKGGDFSIDQYNIKYSPYKSYVGVKIPKGKGWNDALYSDEPNLIPIVTVDEYGKPVNLKNLKIEVYEISWRWWWQRDSNEDLGYYLRSSNSKKIITDYVNTQNGKAIYELKFPKETWGRKYIKITNPVSGHSTGKIFYTDYKGWWSNPDNAAPGGAEMLTFSTDKKAYNIGETVQIKLPASSQGKALISIENGSRVLQSFWTDVNDGTQKISFEATADMSPNVYIHISYIQPHSQTENDRPIRLYGVQGISVHNPASILKPVIKMPEQLRPEATAQLSIKEASGKPMTYSVFIVDEGLLDLTRFKTPNPWNTFYAKEALGVKTYDMYNYVMSAFSGQIAGLLAVGGDEDLVVNGHKKANRFKPVVLFLGTFQLKKGQTKTHQFTLPNYIGSVRTMVVAGNKNGAYGASDKTTPVKKPLMVLGSLPRVLGPGENVLLPVTVFAMDKKIKNVQVKVQTNDILKILDSPVQTLHFKKEGEQMAYFNLEAAKITGNAIVKITVSGAGEKASYEMDIPVRIANPEITHIQDSHLESNQKWETHYSPIGIKGTNKAVLEISSIPPINLEKRLDYLIQYPHGCIEQTTSSVFPQLYLADLVDLSNVRKGEIQDYITAGLERLKNFQLTNGGFTYWPGESLTANEWGTNYAGHFIIEAKNKGYKLPDQMLEKWIKYQQKKANEWAQIPNKNIYRQRYNQMTQAYRLYTLALAGKPVLGAMNRLRESGNLYPVAKWRLIAAYYLAGKKNTAQKMIENTPIEVAEYTELSGTYGNSQRDAAMILESLILVKDYDKAKILLDQVAKNLSSEQWMSTQTTAYSLLAVSKFVQQQHKTPMKFEVRTDKKSKKYETDKSIQQIDLPVGKNNEKLSVTNLGNQILFIRLYNSGIPLESDEMAFEKNLHIKISYYKPNGEPINIEQIKQGTDFVIEVKIIHPGILNDYKNMALTQIFPSGWELTNSRMDNINALKSDKFTYQDIRDDRIMTYFDLPKNSQKTFRFMANASFIGQYYLPSVKCEAMYDHNIMAITNGKWVQVMK